MIDDGRKRCPNLVWPTLKKIISTLKSLFSGLDVQNYFAKVVNTCKWHQPEKKCIKMQPFGLANNTVTIWIPMIYRFIQGEGHYTAFDVVL